MHRLPVSLGSIVLLLLSFPVSAREPVLGRCEGCEAIFHGQPEDLAATARIAPVDEAGEPMRIEGVVRRRDGSPAAGIVVYAYHTDASGVYPPGPEAGAGVPHGRLRAFVRSDAEGRYAFDSIRPGGYPRSTLPAHVHLHVLEPGCCTYWIDDIEFTDDPRLAGKPMPDAAKARGGIGRVTPVRIDGVWLVRRDIVLGQGIEGYRGP